MQVCHLLVVLQRLYCSISSPRTCSHGVMVIAPSPPRSLFPLAHAARLALGVTYVYAYIRSTHGTQHAISTLDSLILDSSNVHLL